MSPIGPADLASPSLPYSVFSGNTKVLRRFPSSTGIESTKAELKWIKIINKKDNTSIQKPYILERNAIQTTAHRFLHYPFHHD